MNEIPIVLAVEDPLGEVVSKTLLKQSGCPYLVTNCLGKCGNQYLGIAQKIIYRDPIE